MAARWGTGEEILTAHNVKYFSTPTKNEREALQAILAPDCVRTQDLHTGDVLEAVQGCLDPAIFSFFGDAPAGEAKIGVDVESEATLLTALTEILDNVDDENLSPFDTLPDVELLTGQRGQELSPLRKLHSLSLSPPDRESMFHAVSFSSPAKTFSRIPGLVTQRSDGEDEEFLPLSDIDPSMDLIPIASMPLGQDGSSMSFSLGDLVKHVQCMAVCLEEGEEEGIPEGGEQILPDGGILLEVVDFGENGEPILAVPVQLDLNDGVEEESEQVSQPAKELPDQSRKGCDDQKPETSAPLNAVESASHTSSPAVDENEKAVMKRPKEEVSERCPSHRKKKRKNKEAQPPPVSEGRVLRSSTRIPPKKSDERQEKPKKMKKTVTFAPVISTLAPEQVTPITQQAAVSNSPQVKTQTPMKTVQAPLSSGLKDAIIPKSLPVVTESKSVPATESPAEPPKIKPTATPVPVTKATSLEPVSVGIKEEVPEQTEVTAAPSEPKPKPLSLQQYRLLRQQKKPAPVLKTDDNSTKWPSLPEPPKELPPIPHLPQPQLQQAPKDPRRASAPYLPRNVPAPEIKEVWQPKGLAAPPTPEALLVPPASIVAASSRPVIPKPPPVQAAPSTLPPTPAAVEPTPLQVPSNPGQSPDKPLAIQNATASNVPMSAAQQPSTVYKPLPLPSATTPTASQVLKAVVSQPHISQLLAAALKGHKLPLLGPQVPTAATPKMQAAGQASPAVSKEAVAAVDAMVSAPAATPVTAHPKPVPSPQTLVPKPLLTNVMVPTGGSQQQCSQKRESVPPSIVVPAQSVGSAQCTKPAKQSQTPAVVPSKGKSHTEKLIESFTSEMGIEASDLASLLEQFEETQAKVEHRGPEVFGRAAAVGNSRVEPTMENKALEGTKVHDLSSTAGLTPPGTPPHQMWKPLMPVVQQGKSKMAESPKKTPTKLTIQIDPRPMPMSMLRSKTQPTASTRVAFHPFSADHDYCLPNEGAKSLNVEQMKIQQSSDAIKNHVVPQISKIFQQPPTQQTTVDVACNKPIVSPQALEQKQALNSSVLVTPDASPSRCESDQAAPLTRTARGISPAERASSRSPSPYCRKRGRNLRRREAHSRSSSSSSSSSVSSSRSWSEHRSRSPPRKRCYRSRRSPSSSSSRSRSRSRSQSRSPYRRRRYSYSSSRSGSWSRSRSRSNSPESRRLWRRSGHSHRYNSSSSRDNYEDVKKRKEKAIEERRVVYVGRIRGGMTRAELKDRFSLYGDIEDCTLHFREHGDNYGFVTYYNTKDAFNAIESGSELRRPNELPFDLCFGGRRQFCKSSYADLDSNQEYDPASSKRKIDALDFDTLLKQAQKNLRR